MQIPVVKPYLGEEEKKAVNAVLDSGWIVQGAKVAEFETMICQFTGAAFARASSSCTTALHLALVALGVGKGDEVIVPSFTFVASANSIEYTGAKPIFVDIDLKTFCLNPGKIEEVLRQNTRVKCIMPVHLFGLCADMTAIMKLANQYNLFVIEDAACALGSFYGTAQAGTMGDAGCFSFHPRKSITTGEGGMLVTGNPKVAAKISVLRNHGAAISDLDRHKKGGYLLPAFDTLGYNYRMTDIQAAIGIEQMKKLDWIIEQRIKKARKYDAALGDIECLQTPYIPKGCRHTYQSYVVTLRDAQRKNLSLEDTKKLFGVRNNIMARLEKRGIATRQGTSAVHMLGYYCTKYKLNSVDFPCSFLADQLTITLPLYPQMTAEEQNYVIENLRQEIKNEFK